MDGTNDKLIDRLNTKLQAYSAYTDSELAHVIEDAITALSTLQAENAQLRRRLGEATSQTPAADVVPVRHGRWNDINPAALNPGVNWRCRCSLCGCPQDHKHNYCPNCGARMQKNEEKR